MTTSELISYIRKQINNNISKDLIISKLIGAGWRKEDVDEGFLNVESELKPRVPLSDIKQKVDNIDSIKNQQENVDKYREPLEGDNVVKIEEIESPKIEVSNVEKQKVESTPIEIPVVENSIVKARVVEVPKVWTPMKVPVKEVTSSVVPQEGGKESRESYKAETTQIEIQDLELQAGRPVRNTESISSIRLDDSPQRIGQAGGEEFIPTLIPKVVINSFGSINKGSLSKMENVPMAFDEKSRESLIKSLPKIAMISSYQNDLSSANKIEEENVKKRSHKIFKWIILALVIFIIALAIWAFASGYINIKNLNIPFIKKDPKVLLLNNSKVLSSLKSYKTETNVEISSPLFSNIALGLVSGEAVTSQDKDFISVNTQGVINKNESGLISDNIVTIKSSLLQDYITTDIKNNGLDLFVLVPDLSQVLNENAPESSIVKINEQQFNLIPPLFSPDIELALKKINVYKILSNGMPSYINNETLSTYDEFINSVDVTEKGQENIRGIDTYHYSINADRQLAKKLLNKISDNFVLNLSSEDKDGLDQILGSITIDSLDVWIGKGDNNIYQYNVVFDIPLSKIIGFEDKSIGDNQVNINWKTTYYDFNIPNNVIMPDTSIPATDFVNSVKELKIKNDVSSLKQLAKNLFDTEKTYGKSSNPTGSCMSPSFGSLFSPVGHTKSATTAVSSISLLLNKILGITNNAGYCYSTTKAWSFTIPISDDYNPIDTSLPPEYKYFFCVDNTGSTLDLIAPPNSVICK